MRGNARAVALPLEQVIDTQGGRTVTDYVPTKPVVVVLLGFKKFRYDAVMVDGNVATFTVGADVPAGCYGIEVLVDGEPLRSMKRHQVRIVESNDDLPAEYATGNGEFDDTGVQLDAGVYYFAKGEPGEDGDDGVSIASISKTGTSGRVDTYTITYTNGDTDTFTVTNGKDGEDGSSPDMSDYYTKSDTNTLLGGKQDELVSGTNIKTINNASVLGSGNIALATPTDLANYCPIIQDTRSSAVAAITGVAPFASLQDGQRIVLRLAYNSAASTTLNLTLSDNTTTGAIDVYHSTYANGSVQVGAYNFRAGAIVELVYLQASNKWQTVGFTDTNTTYNTITQAEIDDGTATGNRVVTPALLCDNFSKVTPIVSVSSTGDVSQTLDPYKWYSFGELDSLTLSLTAPASGKLGEYFGKFSTSASWSSLSVPSGVTEAAGNDTIAASKTYEFNIVGNKIMVKEV